MSVDIGYIICNKDTGELDWDGEFHHTIESAIAAMTGPCHSYCKTEAERDEDRVPWWDDYDIHPVRDAIRPPKGGDK